MSNKKRKYTRNSEGVFVYEICQHCSKINKELGEKCQKCEKSLIPKKFRDNKVAKPKVLKKSSRVRTGVGRTGRS